VVIFGPNHDYVMLFDVFEFDYRGLDAYLIELGQAFN